MRPQLAIILASTVVLFGCGSITSPKMGNVIPQAEGKFQVMTTGSSQDSAMKSALYTAETTCKKKKMVHVVTGQNSTYKGLASEETSKKVAAAVGVVSAVSGLKLPSLAGEDYHLTMDFYCEKEAKSGLFSSIFD
jgi:hypothetical protein